MKISRLAQSVLIKQSLRAYCSQILPFSFIKEQDALNNCPENILRKLISLDGMGLVLQAIPQAYGGMDCGAQGICAAGEELAKADLGVSTGVLAALLGALPICYGGTDKQKEKWLNKMVSSGSICAFAATEPHGGSALTDVHTKADRVYVDGKLSFYKLHGAKRWITNAGIADLYIVLASAPDGASWFIAEKNTKGLSISAPEDKYGQRLSDTRGIFFDNVLVPAENLIGLKEGNAFNCAQQAFALTRLAVAAMALGAGEEALKEALVYGFRRVVNGASLAENKAYMTSLIVPNFVRLEACRAFIEKIASFSENRDFSAEAAIIKFFASKSCSIACNDALQAFGGNGLSKNFQAEKRLRDSRILEIYEGASEVLKLFVFRSRWQNYLRSGGLYYRNISEKYKDLDGIEHILFQLFNLLNDVFDICRSYKLTRDNFISMTIGEIISWLEAAEAFYEKVSKNNELSIFSNEALEAMSRLFIRQAAVKIISCLLPIIADFGPKTKHSSYEIINKIVEIQIDTLADNDIVSTELKNIFSRGGQI